MIYSFYHKYYFIFRSKEMRHCTVACLCLASPTVIALIIQQMHNVQARTHNPRIGSQAPYPIALYSKQNRVSDLCRLKCLVYR